MANITIENVDVGNVILTDAEFRDDPLTFAGAGTILAGTILARLTATLKLVPFVKGGSLGAEIPVAIITYEVTATGAGDEQVRAGISGKFRKERLIIDADADGSNIDAAVLDQLRDYSLIPIDVQELNILDNQ